MRNHMSSPDVQPHFVEIPVPAHFRVRINSFAWKQRVIVNRILFLECQLVWPNSLVELNLAIINLGSKR